MNLIEFDLDASPKSEGLYILRTGKIFETGEWLDKDFALTADELQNAVSTFAPVDIDLEHESTVLDGKLGQLKSVEIASDGKTLLGTVAIPSWLDNLLEDGKRKVSCTWDRATKTLRGLALVNQPRIADAALMSAFNSSTNTKENIMSKKSAWLAFKEFLGLSGVKLDDDIAEPEFKEDAVEEAPATVEMSADDKAKFAALETAKAELEAELAKHKSDAETAAKDAQYEKDCAWVDEQVKAFKVLPANADNYKALAKANPASFAAIVPLTESSLPVAAISGATTSGDTARMSLENATPDATHLDSLALAYAKEHGVQYHIAFSAISKQNPELALAYRDSQTNKEN